MLSIIYRSRGKKHVFLMFANKLILTILYKSLLKIQKLGFPNKIDITKMFLKSSKQKLVHENRRVSTKLLLRNHKRKIIPIPSPSITMKPIS